MNYRFIFKMGRQLETLKYTRTIHADNMISNVIHIVGIKHVCKAIRINLPRTLNNTKTSDA